MTNHQINIAIAEECGWTDCEHVEALGLCKGKHENVLPQYFFGYSQLPDYCNDLNAMHDAERTLNLSLAGGYARILTSIAWQSEQPVFAPMTATARQRAEAFLRALGKWEESE
jgi:fructose-bisphosphate aldolase class 1